MKFIVSNYRMVKLGICLKKCDRSTRVENPHVQTDTVVEAMMFSIFQMY